MEWIPRNLVSGLDSIAETSQRVFCGETKVDFSCLVIQVRGFGFSHGKRLLDVAQYATRYLVNTAARMESCGMKGKIHISGSTYKELVARGKGHFVTEREDKIKVKGKGKLQTYFLTDNFANPRSGTAVLSSASTNKVGNLSAGSTVPRNSVRSMSVSDNDLPYASRTHAGSDFMQVEPPHDQSNEIVFRDVEVDDNSSAASSLGSKARPHWQSLVVKVDMDGCVEC